MGQPAYKVVWEPQEGPQTALVACPVFEVFYGGARGGGKTDGSLGDWLQHSGQYGEAAVGVFFRRKFKQLSEVIARSKQLFKPLGAKYNEQKAEWLMPNGARLLFRYLERDSDAEEYQGHNYTRIYVEEVTNFPSPAPINKLRATLRSASGVPVGMRLTGNPGGPGHNWVKKRYIDPCKTGFVVISEEEEIELDGKTLTVSIDRIFIPSKLGDNVLLMRNDPTYVLRLRQSGSEALVKAWLEGNWDIIDGAFFDEWNPGLHILGMEWLECIPRSALRFRAFDWGSAKPFSVGWYAMSDGTWGLPNGAMVKYREWYGASGPNKGLKMDAPLVAQGIVKMEQGEHISYGVADPSIFIRNGGPSIMEMMALQQCFWRRGDNRREPGWEQMHIRLKGGKESEGRPMLYFVECCDDSIRTIPTLQHDETNEEDIDTEAEDHAGDEARYAVMSRPWVPTLLVNNNAPRRKLPSEMTINELIAKRTRMRLAEKD
jgi:hypothetical protein